MYSASWLSLTTPVTLDARPAAWSFRCMNGRREYLSCARAIAARVGVFPKGHIEAGEAPEASRVAGVSEEAAAREHRRGRWKKIVHRSWNSRFSPRPDRCAIDPRFSVTRDRTKRASTTARRARQVRGVPRMELRIDWHQEHHGCSMIDAHFSNGATMAPRARRLLPTPPATRLLVGASPASMCLRKHPIASGIARAHEQVLPASIHAAKDHAAGVRRGCWSRQRGAMRHCTSAARVDARSCVKTRRNVKYARSGAGVRRCRC